MYRDIVMGWVIWTYIPVLALVDPPRLLAPGVPYTGCPTPFVPSTLNLWGKYNGVCETHNET